MASCLFFNLLIWFQRNHFTAVLLFATATIGTLLHINHLHCFVFYILKEVFSNLSGLLHQIFVFWVRDFKVWLLAHFWFTFTVCSFREQNRDQPKNVLNQLGLKPILGQALRVNDKWKVVYPIGDATVKVLLWTFQLKIASLLQHSLLFIYKSVQFIQSIQATALDHFFMAHAHFLHLLSGSGIFDTCGKDVFFRFFKILTEFVFAYCSIK